MSTPAQRLEKMYQGRRRNTDQLAPTSTAAALPESDTIDDFDPERDSIRRMRWVFDRILEILPKAAEQDMRYTVMKTMMRESLKDLARIPDRIMIPMVQEIQQALDFVANGSMAELEAYLAQEEENADAG